MVGPDNERLLRRPEDLNIVVRSEQTSMEQVSGNPFLERVGFSPQLSQRLMKLNNVFSKRDAPPLESVGITMVPGRIPVVTTHIDHGQGMRVLIEGYASGGASLRLESESYFGAMVTVDDIQGFIKSLFPNQQCRIFSKEAPDVEEPIGDLNEDLYVINSESLRPFAEFVKAKKINDSTGNPVTMNYHTFVIKLSDQKDPSRRDFVLSFGLRRVHYSDKVACAVNKINYRGRANEVEDAMDKITSLFDKPVLYPFEESNPDSSTDFGRA